jgi:hypothetical protein
MRLLLLALLSLTATVSYAQFDKSVSVNATVNFNVALSGLGTDDAGLGINLQTSFFSKKRLQLTTEAVSEAFFGNKVLYEDAQAGKAAKTRLHGFRIGPQVFLTRNIAVSATYGPTWHKVRVFGYTHDYGYKVSVNSFLGAGRRLVARASFVNTYAEVQKLEYLSIGIGYRL